MFGDSPFQNAIREIKLNAHHMKKALETGDMKETLKYSREMLFQLRTEEIDTREYYQLYILAFDELGWLSDNLQQIQLEKKKYDLYEIVQYSKTILPRLYLMICIGSVLVNKGLKDPMNFLNDVFKMCKGVQHPCRGLFLRYYLLKILRLRIEKNDISQEQLYNEVLPFLLQNFREMNGLWIRINNLVSDKEIRKQERKNLGITLADNLSQISSLPGLNLEIYKEKILKQVLEIILENQDKISQSFLFDIFLSVFPVEFHIPNLKIILEATQKIYRKVNINNIYLKIMERFSEYAKNNLIQVQDQSDSIYDSFKNTLQQIFDSKKYSLARNLQLLQGFMKFSVFFYKENFDYINEILEMTKQLCLKASEEERTQPKAVQCLEEILSLPLQKFSVLVLIIEQFPYLMELLPLENQKKVVIQIIEAIQKTNTFLITEEICNKVLIFLKPLFKSKNEQEVIELSKIIHYIYSCKPKQYLELLFIFENNFDLDNPYHLKYMYPVFSFKILKVIKLTNKMKSDLQNFWNTQQGQENTLDEEALHSSLKQYYRQKYSQQNNASYLSEQEKQNFNVNLQNDFKINFQTLSEKIYNIAFELQIQNPLLAQQIYLELSLLVDQYGNTEDTDNLLYECYCKIYGIFQNEIGLVTDRIQNFNKITGYLSNLKNIDEKILQDIISPLYSSICLLGSRQQQAEALIRFSCLYLNDAYNLKQCFQRCFQLIKMTKRQNKQSVLLYFKVLDNMLYYKLHQNQEFEDEEIVQLLEMIATTQDELKECPSLLQKFKEQKKKIFNTWEKQEDLFEDLRKKFVENNQFLFINGKKFQSKNCQTIKSSKSQIIKRKNNLTEQPTQSFTYSQQQRVFLQRKAKNKCFFRS